METIERLQGEWRDKGRFHALHAGMSLEKDGLVLGAGTMLAKRNRVGAITVEGEEARLLTLLAVAYGRPPDMSVLGAIRRASKHAGAGDESLAAMHIALARLPKLADVPDASRRIFVADGLMAEGVSPRDIWTALEFDPEPLDEILGKYSQNEPRNPKGDGDISGEWTSDSGAPTTTTLDGGIADSASGVTVLSEGAESASGRVASAVGLAIPGLDVGAALLSMTGNAGTAPISGAIPGRPDLRYDWTPDEGVLRIYQAPYPAPAIMATPGTVRGTLVDQRGRKVARLLTTGIQLNIAAISEELPRDDPRRCPKPAPDRPGAGNDALSQAYEDHIKEQNNNPPTPHGYGYWLKNPFDARAVVVDDCVSRRARIFEIKWGYTGLVSSPGGRMIMAVDWGYQATRQFEASQGRSIEWDFSDKPAADWAREVFSWLPWLRGIDVEWKPWDGHK